MPRHLYIHIPFCHRRCSYCDFNTYANLDHRIGDYVAALCADMQRAALAPDDWRRLPPHETIAEHQRVLMRSALRPTIFLGGGTPTMLTLDQLSHVMDAAATHVALQHAEITIEANPGTVIDEDYLRGLRAIGINRISFGVQTLHDPSLRVLGRIHTAQEAIRSYEQARRAGFDRINLDFIFGLPGQTLDAWRATLDRAIELEPDHFSLYSLILEEGTPLHRQVIGGMVAIPDDDAAAAMYELACEKLETAGYAQYEISNWARRTPGDALLPDQAAHHNVAYWLNADYLAFGAGAHGHVYPRRWHDRLGVHEYIATAREGRPPIAEVTELTPADLAAETMMMGLRLNAGVSFAHFADRCGKELLEMFGPEVGELVKDGLLDQDAFGIRLTSRGRLIGNQVFMRFI